MPTVHLSSRSTQAPRSALPSPPGTSPSTPLLPRRPSSPPAQPGVTPRRDPPPAPSAPRVRNRELIYPLQSPVLCECGLVWAMEDSGSTPPCRDIHGRPGHAGLCSLRSGAVCRCSRQYQLHRLRCWARCCLGQPDLPDLERDCLGIFPGVKYRVWIKANTCNL